MISTRFAAALVAAMVVGAPASHAQDIGEVIGGIAKTYLAQEQDKAAFAQAQATNTEAAYRRYLEQFPKGMYATAARDRVNKLATPATPTAPPAVQVSNQSSPARAEIALGLSRSDRTRVQQRLVALGYDTRGVDGIFGSATRRALSAWQAKNGTKATGYLTAADLQGLQAQAPSVGGAADDTESPQTQEQLIGLDAAERRDVQQRLTRLGYDTRGVDGIFGRGTRGAIARWQVDNGERGSGYLSADQLKALRERAAP